MAADRRAAVAVAAVAAAVVALVSAAVRRVMSTAERACWPPPAGAVTADGARAATEAFAADGHARRRDAALPFAWSTAASAEPRVGGEEFFPRIFADVEAARSSVHILMFGWREGEVGTALAGLLARKAAEGVAVRVLIDGYGSKPYKEARAMFSELAAAGAAIVVNDVLPPARIGHFPDGLRIDPRQHELGSADHRKLYVVDGTVAWTGGAGIEDHFRDGRFHDVMTRLTGDVVRQAQAAFLTSFHAHGGRLTGDLAPCFPEPGDRGSIPVVLAQVVPGGFAAATQAIREQIDRAQARLDVMNPYLTDHDMIERILAAARRGAKVRLVISETSNSSQAAAALKHRYADLLAAGAEIFEVPGTVVHAKVVVADDEVSFGTVNLDAWSLHRDSEIMVLARSAEVAAAFDERLFAPDIARARRGAPPTAPRERLESALWHALATFL
ncbi:MAG TPA: phosphatidylserine/phosphatidylglycerophosphate/cardiolipin synthase family protein [Solirubrobacteraceae bacterium]|nr:phosphatidylserine/phosphatidylglycerophosphate/cardiolipin synthase family protein [Solirubrobacteraceae bacterium]